MGNQHTGAPLLKGGLLQRYQLQARVCGSIAETQPGPGLLGAAAAASAARCGPAPLLCAPKSGSWAPRLPFPLVFTSNTAPLCR